MSEPIEAEDAAPEPVAEDAVEAGAAAAAAPAFPALPESITGRRRRRWGKAVAAVVAVAAVALVVGGLVMRSSASPSPTFRSAPASQHLVESMLHGVGTVEPVSQASVGFPVSGTVSTVNVKPGDTVTAGQALASLDTTALLATLHQQQQALAQAQLTLQNALDGKSVAAPAVTQAYHSGDEPTAVLLAAVTDAVDPDVAADEQAVVAAQHQVDTARNQASAALQSATTVCAAIGQSGSGDPSGQSGAIDACQTALQAVQDAQAAVTKAQNALATASKNLDDLLTKIANEPPPTTTPPTTTPPTTTPPTTTAPPTTTTPPTTEPQNPPPTTTAPPGTPRTTEPSGPSGPNGPSGPSGPSGSTPSTSVPASGARARSGAGGVSSGGSSSTRSSGGTGGASTGRAPTAEDLAAYQSAVDADTANVTMAQQALDQATIASPIAGTVIAVNLTAGASATAASSTETILIQGAGGYEANTTVSINDVPNVKVGQPASVTVDGASAPVNGKVVAISPVPTSAANASTTNYGVVISLPADATSMRNGAIGSVAIVTGAGNGLSVPSSAVTTTAGIHTVTVLEGDKTRQVIVQVGVVGDTWTQITGGLQAGEQVVLADVNAPLPSSATDTSSRTGQTQNANNRFVFPFAGGAGGGTGTGGGATTRTRTTG